MSSAPLRHILTAASVCVLLVSVGGCTNETDGATEATATVRQADASDVVWIGKRNGIVSYASRTSGYIASVKPATGGDTPAADRVDMSATVREQAGLLGVAELNGDVFVSYTRADGQLVVSTLNGRTIWNGTTTQNKAIGGHLEVFEGKLVIGLGELTGWAQQHGSGALVALDPAGPPDQQPVVLTDGWHNPFAFTVVSDETGSRIWVADNAPDGGKERIGRGDKQIPGDTETFVTELPGPQRAPSAIVSLPYGRLAVCGWLDKEIRAYEITNQSIERAGTIGTGCDSALALIDNSIWFAGEAGISEIKVQ